MEKTLLIVNPVAGTRWKGRSINRVVEKLKEAFPGLELTRTKGPGDATTLSRKAASDGYKTIISVGGDGTINETINGMAGSDSALGVIPMGTGNALAREIGLSLNPVRASSMISHAMTKRISLGIANGRYFVIGAGIGFDAQMMERVDRQYKGLKRKLGVIPYILAGLGTLSAYNHPKIRFIVDGEEYIGEYGLIVKSNAGRFKFANGISLEDSSLLLCLFKKVNTIPFLRYWFSVLSGSPINSEDIAYIRGNEIYVTSDDPISLHVDGEVIGATPVKISLCKDGLNLLVPRTPYRS